MATLLSSPSQKNLKRSTLTIAACAVTMGYATQNSYAEIGFNNSAIKLPDSVELDRSLQRLNDAWSTLQNQDEVRSLLSESRNSLSVAKRIKSSSMETVKFQHYYDGLEVVGSMAMHQTGAAGETVLNRLAALDLNTEARLSEQDAIGIAKSLEGEREFASEPELKILPEAEGSGARLVYWMTLNATGFDGAREIIVDANSGEVIGNISKNIEIAPVSVFSAQNLGKNIDSVKIEKDPITKMAKVTSCGKITDLSTKRSQAGTPSQCMELLGQEPPKQCQILIGGSPTIVVPKNCTPQVNNNSVVGSDSAAMRAFKNAQTVLTYYQTHHGRNSYDNKGSTPMNVVHAGLGYNNAFWNSMENIMVYGDGDGQVLKDFTNALDVAGHEQTHGVVAFSAKLLGMGESGALNEAFADFFGKMIANDGDWAIGRNLFVDQAHAKGVRDLSNPGALTFCAQRTPDGKCTQNRPFPSTYKEKMSAVGQCGSTNDNCWVHINSTIPGHASYLVVQAIGAPKAEKLYYAALTQSLTSRDDIKSAANSIKSTCRQVLDATSCGAVDKAYAKVGL